MVADTLAHVLGNFTLKFNIQIGNTPLAVEDIGFNDGLSWTCIEAPRTAAAPVRSGYAEIQIQIRQDAAEEKPRSHPLVDHAGVFSKPADTGVFGKNPLQQRSGIDVRASLPAEFHFDPCRKLAQLVLQCVVI